MECEKIWKDRGFICYMLRNPTLDTLNGYIVIPPIHPWYKKHYDSIYAEVHGGLTFSEEINEQWVIGFDTNHYGDGHGPNRSQQADNTVITHEYKTYKDENYVENEIEKLVTQALNVCDMYEREDLYNNSDAVMAKLLLIFND